MLYANQSFWLQRHVDTLLHHSFVVPVTANDQMETRLNDASSFWRLETDWPKGRVTFISNKFDIKKMYIMSYFGFKKDAQYVRIIKEVIRFSEMAAHFHVNLTIRESQYHKFSVFVINSVQDFTNQIVATSSNRKTKSTNPKLLSLSFVFCSLFWLSQSPYSLDIGTKTGKRNLNDIL